MLFFLCNINKFTKLLKISLDSFVNLSVLFAGFLQKSVNIAKSTKTKGREIICKTVTFRPTFTRCFFHIFESGFCVKFFSCFYV